MASPGRKHDGTAKNKGSRSDLINFDHRNESMPLKQDVAVRKSGGLFLAPNGVKVEIPPGASTGRRERLLCSSISSTARGALGPWLGPNLRMASDMQIFYAPTNFRQPVAIFIPLSFAATRELSFPLPEESVDKSRQVQNGMGEDSPEMEPIQAGERPQMRPFRSGNRSKGSSLSRASNGQQLHKFPPLIDTRSLFLLHCRLGEDQWHTTNKFTVIQPTVHHSNWPIEFKKMVTQSTRWPDISYAEAIQNTESSINSKRYSSATTGSRPRRNTTSHPTKENVGDPLEHIRRMDNYCGGVCIASDELCHCYVLVIGIRAENFHINRDGGFFRSPLLHPFLSVRVPKRSCLVNRVAAFKAIDVRSNWAQSAVQFDPQLIEVEGCSDIYELELPDVTFRRPATVRLPLPQWFINRRTRSHENWDQNSTTVASSEAPEVSAISRIVGSEGTFTCDRPLMILYQPPGYKRQIVWQVVNVEDTREELNRRKSRIQMSRKDNTNTPRCKIDNLFCRLGWSYLTVGVRGGPWQLMKQPVYYTQRTAFFETNVLGRFVLIGARDPERTTASKLAHLMTRVEALATAPPGALLISLNLQPNCWKFKADVYPEERLADAIQEQVAAGYVPLIQMTAGSFRKINGLCNAILQANDVQQNKDGGDLDKPRINFPYRLHGGDINHVLLFNGLCLEFRFTGDVNIKPVSQCDAMLSVFKAKDGGAGKTNDAVDNAAGVDSAYAIKRSMSVSILGNKLLRVEPRPDVATLLTKHARLQHHELLHHTACEVEIEPQATEEGKYIQRCVEKAELVTELLRMSVKKQENTQTEDEEEELEEDEESEEHGGRRGSINGTHSQSSFDADDAEVDEATKEAQEQVLRDQPLSTATINMELLRRLNNINEKNKVIRSADFINKVHSLLHVGTVEVWLISPEKLPQLNTPLERHATAPPISGTAVTNSDISLNPTPQQLSMERKQSVAQTPVEVEEDMKSEDESVGESHNAIRWNQTDNLNGGDPNRPTMNLTHSESSAMPKKPLVSYNLLIDPDIVVSYLRTPQGKGGVAGNAQKKGTKGRQQASTSRSRSQTRQQQPQQQRNVSATAKLTVRPGTSLTNEITWDLDDSENLTDSVDNGLSAELKLLSNTFLRTLALQIQDPQKLAEALGLPLDEYTRISRTMEIDQDSSVNQCTYEVLKAWKSCYASDRIRLNASVCGSTRDGDTTTIATTEQTYRSPLSDLVDVLQSVGCFEAVELVTRLKNATHPRSPA